VLDARFHPQQGNNNNNNEGKQGGREITKFGNMFENMKDLSQFIN
jgi:hypothetical protein